MDQPGQARSYRIKKLYISRVFLFGRGSARSGLSKALLFTRERSKVRSLVRPPPPSFTKTEGYGDGGLTQNRESVSAETISETTKGKAAGGPLPAT
jgi:hypothetical protein